MKLTAENLADLTLMASKWHSAQFGLGSNYWNSPEGDRNSFALYVAHQVLGGFDIDVEPPTKEADDAA